MDNGNYSSGYSDADCIAGFIKVKILEMTDLLHRSFILFSQRLNLRESNLPMPSTDHC